jgi:hypothetical protein
MGCGFAQANVESATAAVFWVCWLEGDGVLAEAFFMQPQRHFAAQPPFPFRCVKMTGAMQSVAGIGRRTLASDDENVSAAMLALAGEEMQEFDTRCLKAFAVEIKLCFGFDLAAVQALGRAPVELGKGWWRV